MTDAVCTAVRGAVRCLSLFADELGDEQVMQVRVLRQPPARIPARLNLEHSESAPHPKHGGQVTLRILHVTFHCGLWMRF